jgi:aryl-alcohol dehydrogenase-like predicted oxidoreductase
VAAQPRPQNFLVSTKGGHPPLENMEVSRLSPEDIAHDCKEASERLQLIRLIVLDAS